LSNTAPETKSIDKLERIEKKWPVVIKYLGWRFNGGAVSKQQLDHFDVILLAGDMQRREAILTNTTSTLLQDGVITITCL